MNFLSARNSAALAPPSPSSFTITPAARGGRAAKSATEVVDFAQRPPRTSGTIVKDEGDGGVKVAEFLAAQKFI